MRKKFEFIENLIFGTGAGVLGAIVVIILLIVSPIISLITGWIIGMALKLIAGNYIASGLSILLHTTITADMLPKFFVVLSVLASFIRPALYIKHKLDKK